MFELVHVESLSEASKFKGRKVFVKPKSYDIDPGVLSLFGSSGNAVILLDLSEIFYSSGIHRSIAISKFRRLLRACNKFKAFYAFSFEPKTDMDKRSNQELGSICALLGLNRGQSKHALKMKEHLKP
ncbi:MAG: hypothetical protein ACP5NX_02915 [Candidatus Bilamarchaeaceae archaeon]